MPLECPEGAPHAGYHGYAELVPAPKICDICGCDTPDGECGLPSPLIISANNCSLPGGILTPFGAPANWDGSCTAQDAIQPGAQCNGSLCAKSISIDPLTLTESCTPHVIVPKDGPHGESAWAMSALGCVASDYPPCSPTEVCAPPKAPEFSTCIFTWGDRGCPGSYPDKHVFYDDFSDTRACTGCSCEPPTGSVCTALLELYKDNACTSPLPPIGIASTGLACSDFQPPGPSLGSKAISNVTYTPGSCEPRGGEQTGEVEPAGPATFCCLQS